MYRYEVTLKIYMNSGWTYVKTIITAGSNYQAHQLALAQAGPGGELIFGPYQIE